MESDPEKSALTKMESDPEKSALTKQPKKISINESEVDHRRGSIAATAGRLARRRSSVPQLWASPPPGCGCLGEITWKTLKWTIVWILYLIIGAVVFIRLEETTEIVDKPVDHHNWARFKDLLKSGEVVSELLQLRKKLISVCGHPFLNQSFDVLVADSDGRRLYSVGSPDGALTHQGSLETRLEEVVSSCRESLIIVTKVERVTNQYGMVDAIYYTMTAVTTIGYGHISPTTRWGKLFCVLYCIVGVPLTCILLAKSTEMLSNRMNTMYSNALKGQQRHQKLLLYGITWIYLSIGFVVFMFLPSCALVYLEDWTYEDSLYFTFITLTTIGYGDMYAGYSLKGTEWESWQDLYKMGVIIWIMIALGYWFLLLNFLTKALKSKVTKRIRRIKKTFTPKGITEQAEFFRGLVKKLSISNNVKVKLHRDDKEDDAGNGVMSLMVEVAGALKKEEPSMARRNSIKQQLEETIGDNDGSSCTEGDEESEDIVSLNELLAVNVVIRSENVKVIRNIITQVTFDENNKGKNPQNSLDAEEIEVEEVTLPLRDVLNLVAFIATVEDQMSTSTDIDDDILPSSPNESVWSTITSSDPRESMPLLKDIFAGRVTNTTKLRPRSKVFNVSEVNLGSFNECLEDKECESEQNKNTEKEKSDSKVSQHGR